MVQVLFEVHKIFETESVHDVDGKSRVTGLGREVAFVEQPFASILQSGSIRGVTYPSSQIRPLSTFLDGPKPVAGRVAGLSST
jgi:hypothetical protein